MRRHDPHNAARFGVQSSSDNPQHDVLACKDARNLPAIILHDADGGCAPLSHQFRRLADGRLDADRSCRRARIKDRSEIGETHLVAQSLDIGHERVGRSGIDTAELFLGAFESGVELLRRAVGFLELLERFVEYFRDVEETDDVAVFVANGLQQNVSALQLSKAGDATHQMAETACDHRLQSVGRRGRVASDHRIGRHDGRHGGIARIESISDDLRQDAEFSLALYTRQNTGDRP